MSALRPVLSVVTALSLLGSACSADDPAPGSAGGASGTGTSGQAGTPAAGGTSATGGANSNGGTSGKGGTTGSGGSGQSGTGGVAGTGGSGQSGAGGVTGTGGGGQSGAGGVTSAGGSTSAGAAGVSAGGASGSAGVGGSAAGASGSGGKGGAAGTSGSGAGGSSAGAGGAAQSAGCGQTRTLQNGTINIMFNNASRNYILRVPEDYDNNHPYRLVFAYAESGASAMSVATRNYFTMATLDTMDTTIFVAPDAANGMGSWSASDVELTDAILEELESDLCIDKTRLFATGFSFGGAMSLALACQRADVFRGVAFFSGADLTGSCTGTLTKPIAYYASQASGDSSGDPIPSSGRIKQAQFAAVNGCTAEPSATTFPAAGQPHKCTVYQGCSAGHPTVYCVFDGAHGWEPRDPGESMSWNAPAAWEFITQF
jgi:poly(3-hydroxybutyrate) depolymerase